MNKNFLLKPNCYINLWPSQRNNFVIYFHGGGLVYGTKNDLPQFYINRLNSEGFDVILLDYLLSPPSSLKEIISDTFHSLHLLLNNLIQGKPYVFFGRSAGSYLMLKCIEELLKGGLQLPESIINYYGFYDLEFLNDNANMKTQNTSNDFNDVKNIYDDPLFKRYAIYFNARKHGNLLDVYGVKPENIKNYSIEKTMLGSFPRSFSVSSINDQEVPYFYSKRLSKLIPDSKYFPVYGYSHDFISKTEDKTVTDIFEKSISFIKEK